MDILSNQVSGWLSSLETDSKVNSQAEERAWRAQQQALWRAQEAELERAVLELGNSASGDESDGYWQDNDVLIPELEFNSGDE